MTASFHLFPACSDDIGEVARLHRDVRERCLPYLPPLHTPADDLRYFRDQVFASSEVWVAKAMDGVIGYSAARSGWLDHLYVEPSWDGVGIGTSLLAQAKTSGSLQLWVFQRNAQARRFYERQGFRLVQLTDGMGNEEREPDALYNWTAEADAERLAVLLRRPQEI